MVVLNAYLDVPVDCDARQQQDDCGGDLRTVCEHDAHDVEPSEHRVYLSWASAIVVRTLSGRRFVV